MEDQRFEELMREAAPTFRTPPEPPLDAMWASIEREHFGAAPRRNVWQRWYAPVIGMAATLFIGIGIGRVISTPETGSATPPPSTVVAPVADVADDITGPYRAITSRYLGQAVALLVALPEATEYNADGKLVERAGELLSTTRLLIDSPAGDDPELKVLLDDLELVLAQIVRLSARRHDQEMELITDALEERDVLPRLQNAVTSFPLSATN